MQFTTFASTVLVVFAATFAQASPIAAPGNANPLLTAREPKCLIIPE